jgi:hypothetical protein
MDAVRRAVVTSQQIAIGASAARKWAVTSGTMTIEVSFVCDVDVTCTALVVDIEGSITGNYFFALASHTLTTNERANTACMFHIVDKPIVWVRSNISTLTKTGVGDVKVTIDLLSYD